jgi:NitT/TauT family transport system substrate-binding protein
MGSKVARPAWSLCLLAALAVVGGVGLVVSEPPAPAAATQALARVRMGVLGVLPEAGIFIALEQGYYREQGIELDLTQFDSAARMVPSLGTGQLDAGDGSHSAGLFNAVARGIGIKLVADAASGPPGHPVVSLMFRRDLVEDGQVRGPGDLRGRRVALPARGIPTEVLLATWLRPAGLSIADVEIIEMGFPDQIAAFGAAALDATVIPEPFQTRLVDQRLATVYQGSDEVDPGFQVAELMYSASFAREQPELARRFMLAYLRGVRVYNDAVMKRVPAARQMMVAALVQHTPVKDPALYERMVLAALHPDGRINVASLAQHQEYWLATGVQQTRIDLDALIDYSFADAAVQVLGPYQ